MQPIVEIRTIQYMMAIEREGSFQKAADALYVSQPALSQYIKRVEDGLSFQLYERDKGKCIPTNAGRVLLEHGNRLLESYNSMMDEMRVTTNVQDINIGWPTGYTVRCFNKLLSYMRDNTLASVNIVEDSVEKVTSLLLQGSLDLIFVPVIYSHSNIDYVTVRHEEFFLAVPKDHVANTIIAENQVDGCVDLYYLREMPFLVIDAKAYTDFFYSLFGVFGETPNILFSCKDWDRGLLVTEQGSCLSILPYWYAEEKNEHLNFYRIKSTQSNYRIFAYGVRKNALISPESQTVIDYMAANYGDEWTGEPVKQEALALKFHF